MNSEMLSIPVLPTTGGQKSYEYRATSVWNEWQLALKLSESVTSLSFNLGDYFRLKRKLLEFSLHWGSCLAEMRLNVLEK